MKLTLSGSPSEIENILSRISFGNKDPTVEPILIPAVEEKVPEVKQEVITKVIKLPPIFDTKIERVTSVPKPVESITEVDWKTIKVLKNSKSVDITFADSWAFYKRFVSVTTATRFFNKSNLWINVTKSIPFKFNGIRFNIKYTNNVCK